MIRVVFDTNLLVAALQSSNGASFALLKLLASDAPFRLCLSVPLVLEYESALKSRLGAGDPRIEPVLEYLCQIGDPTEIFFLWRPFLRDPADEMVLEVAVGSRAEAIVTHNIRDFAGAEERFGIRVIRPAEFLAEIRRER